MTKKEITEIILLLNLTIIGLIYALTGIIINENYMATTLIINIILYNKINKLNEN